GASALRCGSGTGQRLGLGMGPAARLGPAAADNAAAIGDDAAYRRVRPDTAETAPGQAQRRPHHLQVKAGRVLVSCHGERRTAISWMAHSDRDCFVGARLAMPPGWGS